MRSQTYKAGNLGPVSWRDPKTGTMLWLLAAMVAAAAAGPPLIIAAVYIMARAG